MVVCQPGITDVAKSKDTIVCTESTRGVANPARTKDTSSKRCQSFALPLHPKDKTEQILFVKGVIALSLNIAKSGSKPVHQNTNDTERYVEIANTSQSKGELKLTQSEPKVFGSGRAQ